MDSQQPQRQAQPQPQSRDYLKPPSAHPQQQQQQQQRAPTSSAPSIPRAPVTAHPSATIADTATFQGKYSVAIGAGTVVHPRAKVYSFEGPVVIGQGCIICEKAIIGTAPTPTPTPTPSAATTPSTPSTPEQGVQTRISHNAVISPLATVHSGATVHSAATIDCLATVHAHADIGAHAKVCASCVVAPRAVIKEWVVVWGAGAGLGQRRRKRAVDGVAFPGAAGAAGAASATGDQAGPGLQGEIVEDARLVVLAKERETLVRLIGAPAGAAAGPRRR